MSDYNELDFLCALDLETGGLNAQSDQVLEVFASFGRIVPATGWEPSEHYTRQVLPLTDDVRSWHPAAVEMHSKNGLLHEARKLRVSEDCSEAFRSLDRALFEQAVKFRGDWGGSEKTPITLLGNSVHFDLAFVRRVFPSFAKTLSHRVFDVSACRLFCESLGMPKSKAEPAHRAEADAAESLRFLAGLREYALTARGTLL